MYSQLFTTEPLYFMS